MPHDKTHLERLIAELQAVRASAGWLEREFQHDLDRIDGAQRDSARNLLHYLALRRRDLRGLQEDLAGLGLSSLGRAEAHVIGTIDRVLHVLHRLDGGSYAPATEPRPVGFVDGRRMLRDRTGELFGGGEGRNGDAAFPIRVMVTMPTAAATDYELVRDLVANGMSCMRVNCAHDSSLEWGAMVEHLRRAREDTGRHCQLLMDLAGPKIRTGAVEPGPQVIRWEPEIDAIGETIAPAQLWLTPAEAPESPTIEDAKVVPVPELVLSRLEVSDRLEFRDLRGRARSIVVRARAGRSCIGASSRRCFLGADTLITVHPTNGRTADPVLADPFTASTIPPAEQGLALMAGDHLVLSADQTPAVPVLRDAEGALSATARIACATPEIFDHVEPGERVLFDDGKIGGVIVNKSTEALEIRITHPIGSPKKLRADKGINFPDSDLGLPALTAKDLEDLEFVLEHADLIGFSFVNRPSDVEQLQEEIARRSHRDLGIVLKIETRKAFERLPRLLLTALRSNRVGVMIARGDLAVECGYERLAEVQEEILWLCEAAHVPVVWATQVLDRLSKKGVPTRAEVTDAAMSERAECVMLNKGPHIVESVQLLQDIVGRMQGHFDKKTPRLRALGVSLADEPPPPRGKRPAAPTSLESPEPRESDGAA